MALNPETLRNELVWRWRHFAVFSGPAWHRVLSLRTQIFVVEQTCPYQEVDDTGPTVLASRADAPGRTDRHPAGCACRSSL
jgi:hypothetical protein